jgi:hypothetical protein
MADGLDVVAVGILRFLCWRVRRFHPFAARYGFNPNKRVGNDMREVLEPARAIRRLQLLLARSKGGEIDPFSQGLGG